MKSPETTRTLITGTEYLDRILYYVYLVILKILAFIHWIERTGLFYLTHLPSILNPTLSLPTPSKILSDTINLSNIPSHIAIVYKPLRRTSRICVAHHGDARNPTPETAGEVDEWMHNIARVACWCAIARISQLTVYDERGDVSMVSSSV